MSATQHVLVARDPPAPLSIVIPCFNEQEVVPLLRQRLTALLDALSFDWELIMVNDGSSDETLRMLLEWGAADPRVRVIGLARNFGHQVAVTAGLDHARGDAVVVMDADLQDPPEVIRDMVREYCRGYDVVYAQRISRRGETVLKRLTAWAFYRFMRLFVLGTLPADVGDFRLMSRRCVEVLNAMPETHRFLRGMAAWTGFAQTAVRFERPLRAAGRTKYGLWKMLRLAWTATMSFSPAPLRFILAVGIGITLAGCGYGVYAVIRILFGLYVVPGWTSVITLTCMIGGAIIVSIGVLGDYVARIFEEVKGRPLYVVSLRANVDSPEESQGRARGLAWKEGTVRAAQGGFARRERP